MVVYVDLACLIGQVAYLAASTMIYCCSVYNFGWLLLCGLQALLCISLFNAIRNRVLYLLRFYISVGVIGRTIILFIWILVLLITRVGGFSVVMYLKVNTI
jgi:hypothetical protein